MHYSIFIYFHEKEIIRYIIYSKETHFQGKVIDFWGILQSFTGGLDKHAMP